MDAVAPHPRSESQPTVGDLLLLCDDVYEENHIYGAPILNVETPYVVVGIANGDAVLRPLHAGKDVQLLGAYAYERSGQVIRARCVFEDAVYTARWVERKG